MAKTTILAIFMVVLVLGTVTMESQGQELCHEYFVESGICVPKHCADRCTDKWKGSGKCFNGTKICGCTFKCKT
ncbi:hypothetical protein YC2023_091364 [Brassica napus]